MANPANIEVKAKQVEEIREKLEKAQSVVVFDYRGLTVEEVTNLRSEMRKAGVEYVVLKNHIVNRAAQANGVDESFHNYLKGPSAFAFGYDDAVAPARILKDTVKKRRLCGHNIRNGQSGRVVDMPCCERCYNRPTDTRQDENGQDMDGSAYRPCG